MRVLLIGGSGLVGRALAERLAARPEIRLDLLLRHPPQALDATVFANASLTAALESWRAAGSACDVFVSALGTTRSIAGSIEAFARIDRDLVMQVARAARASGARQAVIVSSVGADARSRNAYLRVKGELEQGVAALGFERCDILQPGLLLGARPGQAARPAERFGQWLAPFVNPLLVGPLARYRAIEATVVASAAATWTGAAGAGVHRHGGRELSAGAGGHGAAH